jgi:hypothetical protein
MTSLTPTVRRFLKAVLTDETYRSIRVSRRLTNHAFPAAVACERTQPGVRCSCNKIAGIPRF